MEEEYRGGGEIQPIISEQVKINGILAPLTLSADGKLRWIERGQKCLTVEKQVLGFSTEGSFIKIKAFLERETGVYCGGGGNRGIRLRKDFVFEPISEESKRSLCEKLQARIDSYDRPKRLFIIVNPYGGKKSASKIFEEEVKPLLEAADIQYTVQETHYRLHAKEVSHTLDLTKYDGIVCVSGDGILVEVVNGLLQREDWASAIKMPLGIVSAGTGNGMVKSLLDEIDEPCSVSNVVLAIIRGHKCSLDVATVLQGKTRFFSVLMLAWGLVADIDVESEKYRWMGSARLDFYGLLRVIRLRKYNGRVSFVPAPGYETFGEKSNFHSLHQNQADNVKVVENDGYLDLILMRDCSKSALLTVMTKLNDGSHVKSPHVFYLKVRAFILEPGQRADDPSEGGIIDSDGEVLARGEGAYRYENKDLMTYGPLQITVDQGLATLFSPRL
ncbi:hypothetical protein MKX01_015314 [Papaver californicum]|nr:hypothetical protein MKX01_015314 [Papaver californicum]